MQCRSCNAKLEEGALFCTQCGTKIEQSPEFQEDPNKEFEGEKLFAEEPIQKVDQATHHENIKEEVVAETPALKTKVNLEKEEGEKGSSATKGEAFEAENSPDEKAETQRVVVEEVPVSQELVVQKEFVFCGHCGTRMEAGGMFCENCGKPLSEEPLLSSQNPKKVLPLKKILALLVVLSLVFVGVQGVRQLFSGFGKGKATKEIYYLKGSEMYRIKPDSKKTEPVLYAENIYLEEGVEELYGWEYFYQLKSKDGKIDFIVEDYNTMVGTFTLSYRIGNKEKQEIDDDVQSYTVTDNNKVLYVKNDNLYLSDLKNREKIASGVMDYLIDKDQKIILWTEPETTSNSSDIVYSLYYQDIQLKKDKVELEDDVTALISHSEDFSKLLIRKDDAVYMIRNLKDEEKLVDDVDSVYSINIDKESFYYTQSNKIKVKAMDAVTDDMKAKDAAMKEPNRKDYEKTETSEGFFSYTYTTVDDKYYEDKRLYDEKQQRDRLRDSLKQKTLELEGSKLYYYTGKDKQLINEDVLMVGGEQFNEEKSEYYIIYYALDMETENKIKLSEITYEGYLESQIWTLRETIKKPFLNMAGKDIELKVDKDVSYIYPYEVSGTELYATVNKLSETEESKDALVSISLSDKDAGTVTEKDDNINNIYSIEDGNVYYFKNRPDSFDSIVFSGDFYRNGELLAEEVREVRFLKGNSGMLILSEGDLFLFKGKDKKKIADDVEFFSFFDERSIVVLRDYNRDRMEGDLEYFNGKELKPLDTDVKMIVDHIE
ncbi:MAG: zinc ribbon domain-containing protein [Filifactor alocis]|nr:zinc ribbon domain-containing protein [Filifactor alocis]